MPTSKRRVSRAKSRQPKKICQCRNCQLQRWSEQRKQKTIESLSGLTLTRVRWKDDLTATLTYEGGANGFTSRFQVRKDNETGELKAVCSVWEQGEDFRSEVVDDESIIKDLWLKALEVAVTQDPDYILPNEQNDEVNDAR